MAWRMSGMDVESCSCRMICPCPLGPAQPDQGWCAGVLVWDIQQGNSDAVNLAGCKFAFAIDLPGDLVSGGAIARLYIDEAANANQRRELEAIITGKKGGAWAALGGLVAKWLPTQFTKVSVETGENPSATIGTVGQVKLARIKTEDGRQAKLDNPPALAGLGILSIDLAQGNGSYMFDPDMRRWLSGGNGTVSHFSMSG